VLAIVGPTAAGKSLLALRLAARCGGEIVSADSMQVYRGMDIGTAKPGPEERARVPHHLIDVADPAEPFSVAAFQRLARAAVEHVAAAGRLPVVAGGTGLYVRALLHDYDFTPPGREPRIRDELARRAQEEGPAALHRELEGVDAVAAGRIHPNDARRIVRALEVYRTTGRRLSDTWLRGAAGPLYDSLVIGLRLDREELYRRIDQRVENMVRAGLAGEVRDLMARGYTPALISGQALGYKEIVTYLQGRGSLEEAVAQIKRATRNYARRQMTWFRKEPGVVWIDVASRTPAELEEQVAGLIRARWERRMSRDVR